MKKIAVLFSILFAVFQLFALAENSSNENQYQSCGQMSNLLSSEYTNLADTFVTKYNEKMSKLSDSDQKLFYNTINTKIDELITKYQNNDNIKNLLQYIKCSISSSYGVNDSEQENSSGDIQTLSLSDFSDISSGNENIINYQSGYITLDIKYPSTSLSGVNKTIRDYIYSQINDFIQNMPQEKPYADGLQYSLYIDYKGNTIDNKYLTFKFDLSYFFGGAHPTNYLKTFNFKEENQNDVSLGEYLTGKSNYLYQLSSISYITLAKSENISDLNRLKEGTAASGENFQYFNIATGGLTIYFPAYQVAPYAAGEQDIYIPLDELK